MHIATSLRRRYVFVTNCKIVKYHVTTKERVAKSFPRGVASDAESGALPADRTRSSHRTFAKWGPLGIEFRV